MNLSIFDIITSISWTSEARFYVTHKKNEYELLAEYLSGFNFSELDNEIKSMKQTIQVLNSNDKDKIENYFMQHLHGFNEDGTAYIAGATDFSVSLIFSYIDGSTYLRHVYGTEQYGIKLQQILLYLQDLKSLFSIIQNSH